MFNLLICLVLLILKVEADETPSDHSEIRIDLTFNTNESYTVLKDKPLKIIIEKSNAHYVWCVNYIFTTKIQLFVPETEFNTDIVSILKVNKVTAEMSTRWKCTVLQEYNGSRRIPHKNRNYTANDLLFEVHVKGAKPVIVTANNRRLIYVPTNLSVNYDGDANYTYEDGEELDFSCAKPSDSENSEIQLEYHNAEGVLLLQTKPQVKLTHSFRSVLKSTNNNYYLDCIRKDSTREYRYRTTFYMKKEDSHADKTYRVNTVAALVNLASLDAEQHAMILYINGRKLINITNIDQSSDSYMFRYIDGEVLNITCRKMDDNVKGTLRFDGENNAFLGPALGNPEMEIILLNVSTLKLNKKTLICGINNTDVQKSNARILFLSDVPDYGVRILGLARSNILYQYTSDADQMTIEYQYSVNDILNLTCVWKNGFRGPYSRKPSLDSQPHFQWIFKGQSTDSPAISMSSGKNIMFSRNSFTKTLDANHNGTKIQCVFKNDYPVKVKIILRLKPELVDLLDTSEATSDDGSRIQMIVTVVSVGVTAVVITMVCITFWCKRTKQSNLIQNPYDNLSNQNDSPIPAFPHQWEVNDDDPLYSKIYEEVMQDNENYCTTNDKLYRTPRQRHSNISENHYCEIDEYFKPKPDGLATNWNNTHTPLSNKEKERQGTTSNHSNHASYSNICDLKQNTYDKLRHNNLPNKDVNLSNENYGTVQRMGSKNKSVIFGPNMSSKPYNDRRLKQNSEGHYANTEPANMQSRDPQKEPKYENHFLQNGKTENQLDLDYAEPYSDIGITRKNDLYG